MRRPFRHHPRGQARRISGAAEVSRFSIPAPTARQTFNVITVLRMLAGGVWDAGQRHGVTGYYLLMKPALKNLLKRAGFVCEPVGAAVELHGQRIPTMFKRRMED